MTTEIITEEILVEISQVQNTVEVITSENTVEVNVDKLINIYQNAWGEITGDIQTQTDLKTKLDEITASITSAVTLLNTAIAAKQNLLGYIAQNAAYKGLPGGYASLNSAGKVPQSELDIAPQVNADWTASIGVSQILNKPTIPTSVSQLTNDSGYITSNAANITQSAIYRFVSDTEKTTWNSKQATLGYQPEDSANKSATIVLGTSNTFYPTQGAVKAYVDTIADTKVNSSSLAPVATSGSYLDLVDKPPSNQVGFYATSYNLPLVGAANFLYLAFDSSNLFYWDSSQYRSIGSDSFSFTLTPSMSFSPSSNSQYLSLI